MSQEIQEKIRNNFTDVYEGAVEIALSFRDFIFGELSYYFSKHLGSIMCSVCPTSKIKHSFDIFSIYSYLNSIEI